MHDFAGAEWEAATQGRKRLPENCSISVRVGHQQEQSPNAAIALLSIHPSLERMKIVGTGLRFDTD